jgi:hypothetical protein
MTIDQRSWLTFHHVPGSGTNASTSDLHTIYLPEQMNLETRNRGKRFPRQKVKLRG